MKINPISVSELNRYIKDRVAEDEFLNSVFVKGEISNFKHHYTGHMYFTLKDESSLIKCVMFKSSTATLNFTPKDGMKVLVLGSVAVYERDGVYQIYCKAMQEDGMGSLYKAYEELKSKLEKEGLFDESHKKKIPFMPKIIGVLTSNTGAVIRDIINVSTRRNPNVYIRLLPVPVQGTGAGEKIAKAIRTMNEKQLADVIIVARGGGSIEDLWAFNEEIVARAIFECPIPIISAVGHEIDFTIADFVADLRAPTPTGAAEIAVPNKTDVINYINQLNLRSRKAVGTILELKKKRLDNIKGHYILNNPLDLYSAKIQKLDYLTESLVKNYKVIIDKEKIKLNNIKTRPLFSNPLVILDKTKQKYTLLLSKLDALSPLKTLERGYGIVNIGDKAVTSIKDLKKDDLINIELKDGSKEAIIK